MNGSKSRRLGMALVVLVASFILVGSVLADHGSGPVHADRSTRVRYEQYLEALESQRTAGTDLARVPASQATRVRFEQYREAIAGMEQARADALAPQASGHSGTSFEQYLFALEAMEMWFQEALFNGSLDAAAAD